LTHTVGYIRFSIPTTTRTRTTFVARGDSFPGLNIRRIFTKLAVLIVKRGCIAAPQTFNLDIALVKLARPVRLNDNVNVICLPSREDRFPPGTICVTAGWGHAVESEYKHFNATRSDLLATYGAV